MTLFHFRLPASGAIQRDLVTRPRRQWIELSVDDSGLSPRTGPMGLVRDQLSSHLYAEYGHG
jgi:hypothetical protein